MQQIMRQLIIARKDLGMSPGKLAAQVSHASMAFLTSKLRNPKYVQPITRGMMATWNDTPQDNWSEIDGYEYDSGDKDKLVLDTDIEINQKS